MNMKWMSLVAVMTVASVGCSESEQESSKNVASDAETPTVVEAKTVDVVKEVKVLTGQVVTEEQKAMLKEKLSSIEGIPPEKLDAEVKELVAKIAENSDMSEEEAAKLGQDLKSVFQKIEAERAQ